MALLGVMPRRQDAGGGTASGACAPPSRFRAAGHVEWARPSDVGPFTPTLRGRSPAQKAGIRYERRVLANLESAFPGFGTVQPWIRFGSAGGDQRWCQPDFLALEPGRTVLVEIKARLVSDAWYQLRQLYEPVVRVAYKVDVITPVIICRSFDPWTPFPERYTHIFDLREARPSVINVLRWK